MKPSLPLLALLLAACGGEVADAPQPAPQPGPQTATSSPVPPAKPDNRLLLRPVDRSAEDPNFVAYRSKLLAAVAARDTAALEPLIDPKVRTDFGGGGGFADFKRHWKLSSKDSPLWKELETILNLGGSFREFPGGKSFCAPYVYSDWPESADAFSYLAVLGENVPLRARPSDDAPVVASMAYDLVKIGPDDPMMKGGDRNSEWRHVLLGESTRGWVRSDRTRSSIDYRACFDKTANDWKMNLLVAGD